MKILFDKTVKKNDGLCVILFFVRHVRSVMLLQLNVSFSI